MATNRMATKRVEAQRARKTARAIIPVYWLLGNKRWNIWHIGLSDRSSVCMKPKVSRPQCCLTLNCSVHTNQVYLTGSICKFRRKQCLVIKDIRRSLSQSAVRPSPLPAAHCAPSRPPLPFQHFSIQVWSGVLEPLLRMPRKQVCKKETTLTTNTTKYM